MATVSTFEIFSDEVILEIYQYLHTADILNSFFNLNTRLNVIIIDFCRYLNLNGLTHKQFDWILSNTLSYISTHIRSFVINANWLNFISNKLHPIDLASNISLMCPNLYTLTFEYFTGEELLKFLGKIKGLAQLVKLEIKYLEDRHTNNLLRKILTVNNNRLKTVTFDYDSAFLILTRIDKSISYPNIEELIINLMESDMLGDLLISVPNVRRLHVNFGAAPFVSTETLQNVSPIMHLIDFQLRSLNMIWSFDDIANVLCKMPSLQKLTLYLHTQDKRIINGHNLATILPSSLVQLDLLIFYYFPESFIDVDTLLDTWSLNHISISYVLNEAQHCAIIHTVPFNMSSIVILTGVDRHMVPTCKYMQKVKNLTIRGESPTLDLLMTIQHFRRLQKLKFNVQTYLEPLTVTSTIEPIALHLPQLKQLKIIGSFNLFPLFEAAPYLTHLSINFDCYNRFINNESTCQLLHKRITYFELFGLQDSEKLRLNNIIQQFPNLRNIVVSVESSTASIDSLVLEAFMMQRELLTYLCIKGTLVQNGYKSLREWFISHDCIHKKDSFALDYEQKWIHVWF